MCMLAHGNQFHIGKHRVKQELITEELTRPGRHRSWEIPWKE